jgi:hypothetical protein
MLATGAQERFEQSLRERGLALDELDASSAVDTMLDFYSNERADDVDLDDDADMLLFQWGTFGNTSFQYDVTRQFIKAGDSGDEAFLQLSLSLNYEVDAGAEELGSGNFWCPRPQAQETPHPHLGPIGGVGEFRQRIEASPVTAWAVRKTPRHVDLQFGGV